MFFFCVLFFCRKIRVLDATKYHIQLCIAILFTLVVFVAGVDKTAVVGGCIAASVLIHYFSLASVMWMLAESLLLLQNVVLVFQKVTMTWIIITSLLCWCKLFPNSVYAPPMMN